MTKSVGVVNTDQPTGMEGTTTVGGENPRPTAKAALSGAVGKTTLPYTFGNTIPVSMILVVRRSKLCLYCSRQTNYVVRIGRGWYRQCWRHLDPEAVRLIAGQY